MSALYVLENKLGQVVRTFHWQGSNLTMIYREDSRRIMPVASTKELDDEGIRYVHLADVNKDDLAKKSVKIGDVGYLKLVPSIDNVSPHVTFNDEQGDKHPYFFYLKWIAAAHLAVIALVFLIAHFTPVQNAQEEPQIVEIVPKTQLNPPVVQPMMHRHQNTMIAKHPPKIIQHKQPRVAQTRINKTVHTPQASINTLGALGVLGTLSHSNNAGGVNLGQVKVTQGPGLGGTEGSGGVQTSLYAHGLIAAPVGPGGRATGAGGYGTHGRGGGEAGYGHISLVGSSSAFFEPVEREASVEGGLDREQIAEVIQRHLGQIRFCYEQGLQVKPGLRGRVAIRFLIDGSGAVNTAAVSNTSLHSNQVEDCIVGHLRSWKFPEPRGGVIVKVNYPFVLKRVSQS